TFELFVSITPSGEGLGIECQYNAALFEDATVRAWLAAYESLLRAMLREPDRAVRELEWAPAEHLALVAGWNATGAGTSGLVHALVAAQAARTPAAAAVRGPSGPWTYAALSAAATQLAHVLRARGAG